LYAEIERNGAGQAIALWPRNPAKTRPHRVLRTGMLVYKTNEGIDAVSSPNDTSTDGEERTIFAENMLHVPGLAIDARLGQSVAYLSRQVIGLALATEKFGSKLFANGARPGGILTHPGKLGTAARENLKQSWQQAQGGENAHKVAILEEGMKFEKVAQTSEEAQFLQTREHQKLEICSIFSVPPHMIGDAGKAGGKNNLEQIGGEFVTFSLNPWLKSLTQEMERKLFPKTGTDAKRFFPHFDTRPLIMPDASARKDFYGTGKQWGFLSTDDILEMEGLNPTGQEGADLYWMPVNVGVMSAEGAQIPTSPDSVTPDDPNATEPPVKKDKKKP
jgi:HK97 family phage portal protein